MEYTGGNDLGNSDGGVCLQLLREPGPLKLLASTICSEVLGDAILERDC